MSRLALFARTLPHLRTWQILGRIVAPLRRRITARMIPEAPSHLDPGLDRQTGFVEHDPWNSRTSILSDEFCFLDKSSGLGSPVDWAAAGESLLWKFNLHYFNWLFLLEPDERETLCASWVDRYASPVMPAWHPYPTSLRIVNWCKANLRTEELLESLYRQSAFLYRNLETHVYGNHVLENARALIFAGRFFREASESSSWLMKGMSLLRDELAIQILPDGGHYERSPMYHTLMLELGADVLNILPADHPDRPMLESTVVAMTNALETMTHPDGSIALMNDSTLELAPPARTVVAYADRLTRRNVAVPESLPDTGYFTYRDADLYLLVDAGPGGPDHLMAHAHADIFSFELSVRGTRLIVDSGVFEYAAGPMRRYVRSTRAHNTVEIDGRDQIECWDSFRVGRRSRPKDVTVQTDKGSWVFTGVFDGYADTLGNDLSVRRRMMVNERRGTITVEDNVEGNGSHSIESRIHLHPDTIVQEEANIILTRNSEICRLDVELGAVSLEDGWYCPRFGRRVRNQVIVLRDGGNLPLCLRYTLSYDKEPTSEGRGIPHE